MNKVISTEIYKNESEAKAWGSKVAESFGWKLAEVSKNKNGFFAVWEF
jgi:hypothetical protein